jgi:diguanylate cyclase (GGDEF)-like protein
MPSRQGTRGGVVATVFHGLTMLSALRPLAMASSRLARPRRQPEHGGLVRATVQSRDSYAALARSLAYLFLLGSVFALAAMLVSGNRLRGQVLVLVGAGVGSAALLWLRAEHMKRWGCRLLALAGSAATATAVYLTESTDAPGTQSLTISRVHWFLTVATFMLGGVLIHRLVLRMRAYVRALDTMARTDTLTGVANRRSWDEALPVELERCGREGGSVCVGMIDIDHFKAFNDSRGHPEGDRLLQRAVAAWGAQVRATDLLTRYGGEEFAVLLRDCSLADAALILERLREVTPDGQTCSVGVACWDGRESPIELTARADDALYASKRQGRDRITVAEWNRTAPPPPSGWMVAVRELIDDSAVMTAYQPVVDLESDDVLGYEALARTSGRATSMPIAEVFANARRMGMTRELDWLCRRAALRSASRVPTGCLLFLNVSLAALLDPLHGPDQMTLLLDFHKLRPSRVVLEISERDPIPDTDRFNAVLDEYRRHGFRFALDDIGEGRSALETLVAATPEFVKVAPRLVRAPSGTVEHAALRAVLAFAHHSGATVIAEGIETVDDARRVLDLGVRYGQGYLISRPSFETVVTPPATAAS